MSIFSKIKGIVLKYAPPTALGRNSVLFLLKINFANLAGRMYRSAKVRNSKSWQKIEHFWKSIGGDPDHLYNEVKRGMKVKAKHHGGNYAFKFDGYDYDFDSFEPVTTGAAVTTATPLVIKILNILKQAGLDKPENIEKLSTLFKKASDEHLQQAGAEAFKNGAVAKIVNGKPTLSLSGDQVKLKQGNTPKADQKKQQTIIIVIAVIVVLFLFTRK